MFVIVKEETKDECVQIEPEMTERVETHNKREIGTQFTFENAVSVEEDDPKVDNVGVIPEFTR